MLPFVSRLILASLLLPGVAAAATRIWPGAAPCNTTLQACIDGATDGDRIEIATETAIDESPNLYQRSLEIVAANGYRPRLANFRNFSISNAPIGGNQTVLVDGLRLRGGYLSANYLGLGTGNYTLRNLVLDPGPSGSGGGYITSSVARSSLNLTLYNNAVTCGNGLPQSSAIRMSSAAATTLNANVYNNRVACSTQGGTVNYGILAMIGNANAGVAAATIKLHGNEVRAVLDTSGITSGFPSFSGIGILEDGAAASASAIDARVYNNVLIGGLAAADKGIIVLVDRGDMNLQAVNNTIVGYYNALYAGSYNNPGDGTQTIDGIVKNNVMISSGQAFYQQATTTAGLSNDYNLVNAPSPGSVALGIHSITAAAQLVSAAQPRLQSTSPGIDAADTLTLGLGMAFNGLPTTDADGLRRIKGSSGDADIGAYELGDVSFEHRVSLASNTSPIASPALSGNPSALSFASGGGLDYFEPYGLFYSGSNWLLFDQNFGAIPQGKLFNLFVPASGAGLLKHIATAASVGSFYTVVDNSEFNSKPDLIVLATQNWEPNHIYNNHPTSVYYDSGAGRWNVDNDDGQAMPVNAAFNLYGQNASPNAFRVTASAGNLPNGFFPGAFLRVDHPLLDGYPCARPQATRMTLNDGVPVQNSVSWVYDTGNWYLTSFEVIPIGTPFNVVVDPAQVALCSDRIFAHGFE